jgi:hypothetical protein
MKQVLELSEKALSSFEKTEMKVSLHGKRVSIILSAYQGLYKRSQLGQGIE